MTFLFALGFQCSESRRFIPLRWSYLVMKDDINIAWLDKFLFQTDSVTVMPSHSLISALESVVSLSERAVAASEEATAAARLASIQASSALDAGRLALELERARRSETGDQVHCPVSCLLYICLTSEQDHFLFLIATYLNHYTRSIQIVLLYFVNTKLYLWLIIPWFKLSTLERKAACRGSCRRRSEASITQKDGWRLPAHTDRLQLI